MSNEVIKYPFGYDTTKPYFTIAEKTDDNKHYHFSTIKANDFEVDNMARIFESMVSNQTIRKLTDIYDELGYNERETIVKSIVNFTNEFWMFANLLTSLGNKIEIHKEFDSWCGDTIDKVTFNGERVICPTEQYDNIVNHMRSIGINVIGVHDSEMLEYGSKEYYIAMWEQSIGDHKKEIAIKKYEIVELEKQIGYREKDIQKSNDSGWITTRVIKEVEKLFSERNKLESGVNMKYNIDEDKQTIIFEEYDTTNGEEYTGGMYNIDDYYIIIGILKEHIKALKEALAKTWITAEILEELKEFGQYLVGYKVAKVTMEIQQELGIIVIKYSPTGDVYDIMRDNIIDSHKKYVTLQKETRFWTRKKAG